jgi:hypothetical protein
MSPSLYTRRHFANSHAAIGYPTTLSGGSAQICDVSPRILKGFNLFREEAGSSRSKVKGDVFVPSQKGIGNSGKTSAVNFLAVSKEILDSKQYRKLL